MKLLRRILKVLYQPKRVFLLIWIKIVYFFSEELYLSGLFKLYLGRKLDLKNPQTFNEKLQWLKLYNRKDSYTQMVDKVEVKKYIANLIGEEYIIPTIAVWDSVDDIDYDSLPEKFVLKTTNGGGGDGVLICKNKVFFDRIEANKHLKKALKIDLYKKCREWPYKNVKPRIIAEKFMEDENGELIDYKFSCFNGYVNDVMVCVDRLKNDTKFYFFDKRWNLLPLNIRGKLAPPNFTLPKPTCIDEMFDIASKLSKGIPYVRVDLYVVNNKPYFGEITFYPYSGFDANLLPETEKLYSDLIILPTIS